MIDYLSDLDPLLVETAVRMSAQLDELTKTETVIVEKDVLEVPGPLVGYAKERFFEPAAALSGQDLGLLQALYDVVSEVWTQSDDRIDEFQSGMDKVLSHWDGQAAYTCAMYVGSLKGFVTSERDSLWNFAQCLVAYGAVIQEARNNLKQLMDACVGGWDQATHAGDVGSVGVILTLLTSIAGVGISIGTGGAPLGPFVGAVSGAISSGIKYNVDMNGKHSDIADTYLRKSRELIDQAGEAVDKITHDRLTVVRDHLPQLPVTPPGVNDRNTFHPSGEPSQFTTEMGTSRVQNVLGDSLPTGE